MGMATSFPHTYAISLTARNAQTGAGVLRSGAAPAMDVGPPPQFDGRDDWWSPEQLLLGAVASCKMTTFLAIARNKKVPVQGLRCEASGVLDKTREGLRFTRIEVRLWVATPQARCDAVDRIVEATRKHCIVSNALNVPVHLEAEVEGCEAPVEATALQ
jgi:organic hydroperoxide reductase OsmC/OhrA